MTRKTTDGPLRNKERTKQKVLDALGYIIKKEGYANITISRVAKKANVDRRLIYLYFGNIDELIEHYIRSQDFWTNVQPPEAENPITDGGQSLVKTILEGQYQELYKNKALQKIVLWGLLEKRRSLTQLATEREAAGEILLTGITDAYFEKNATQFRAMMAIIVSGLYYISLYADVNAKTFCGVDVTTPQGRAEIEDALRGLVDMVYEKLSS